MSIIDAPGAALDTLAATIKNPFNQPVSSTGARPVDFPGGFVITEYIDGLPQDGTGGRPDTSIKLVGNLMPFQPFPWESEQRLVKQYYPGNPEPSVQALGPKKGDLVIKGRFKDKRYRDPSYYGVAYLFTRALEAMCDRGNVIRFGMYGTAGSWIRFGYLEHVKFDMKKLSDIDYELSFFVIGETQPTNNYFADTDKTSPASINSKLLDAASTFAANYSSSPKTMPQSLAGLIDGLTNTVASQIKHVTDFVSTVLDSAQDVEASAVRALGLIKNARVNLYKYRKQVDSLAHSFSSYSSSGNAVGKVTDTYKNISHIQNAIHDANGMSAYLAQLQKQFEAISQTLPQARYKVQQGDTLQNIAVKFYGAPDHWDKIYDHNNLRTTALTAGTVLEIPKL